MYYYTSLLTPLSGVEIFGWRMLLTVPCMTVFMVVSGEWKRVVDLFRRLVSQPKLLGGLILLRDAARRATVAVHVGAAQRL